MAVRSIVVMKGAVYNSYIRNPWSHSASTAKSEMVSDISETFIIIPSGYTAFMNVYIQSLFICWEQMKHVATAPNLPLLLAL